MSEPRSVCMVIENAGAGTGRHVLDLCRGLRERNWQIHVVFSNGRLESAFEQELNTIEGLQTANIAMRREPGPWDLSAAWQLLRYIRQQGPFSVIHGHSSKGGALVRMVGRLTRSRIFYTPHAMVTLDPNLSAARRRLYTWIERALSQLADGVLCVSDVEFEHARTLGLRESVLHNVPNGIRALAPGDRNAVREALGLQPGDFCLGFVGRLGHQKAVHHLLQASARLLQQQPACKLVVVGDGPEAEALKDQARTLKIEQSVIWTGHADGAAQMTAFDLFVLPSLYEGFPYVLLEAAARGLPMLLTDVGGAAEMQTRAKARVVEPDNPQALQHALESAVADAAWLREAAVESRDASVYFSAERMVDDIEQLYLSA